MSLIRFSISLHNLTFSGLASTAAKIPIIDERKNIDPIQMYNTF
jgi:hypothetical protein